VSRLNLSTTKNLNLEPWVIVCRGELNRNTCCSTVPIISIQYHLFNIIKITDTLSLECLFLIASEVRSVQHFLASLCLSILVRTKLTTSSPLNSYIYIWLLIYTYVYVYMYIVMMMFIFVCLCTYIYIYI
jgi:hypothetical protein